MLHNNARDAQLFRRCCASDFAAIARHRAGALTIGSNLLGLTVLTLENAGPRGAPMTVNRMARRVVMAFALGVLLAASAVAGQDPLTRAKDLYASAAYDEALAVLDQLKLDPSPANAVEAGQYRAFCLLALGRSDEGRKAIAGIVESDPLFQPADTQMSPRLVAVFRDVRRQL